MATGGPNKKESAHIEKLVTTYLDNQDKVNLFREQLLTALSESRSLQDHIHSIKSRLKDPEHLREKLVRQLVEAKSQKVPFEVSPDNLLVHINDLAGVRILHLYTRQIQDIDQALRQIFEEQRYALREGPFARTWDDESREFFEGCGIETQVSPTMYTSVHYVVDSASMTAVTCEIQVRTLMEEVWGEVDHSINYPQPIGNLACREQLRVLARVASSGTRLVDSIFLTYEDVQSTSDPKS